MGRNTLIFVNNKEWLKTFLKLTGGIPTEDSYERIMRLVDSKELNKILFNFFSAIAFSLDPKIILKIFDGRVNNGSKRNATIMHETKAPPNCLNVYDNQYGYCVETIPIDDKTNEIPTIRELIQGMNLTGVIATWDTLNSQTKNVKAVIDAGGDYIIPIKNNQGTFYQDLTLYFNEKRCEEIIADNGSSAYLTYTEKSHSANIKYECFQTSDIKWYSKLNDWEKCKHLDWLEKQLPKKY